MVNEGRIVLPVGYDYRGRGRPRLLRRGHAASLRSPGHVPEFPARFQYEGLLAAKKINISNPFENHLSFGIVLSLEL